MTALTVRHLVKEFRFNTHTGLRGFFRPETRALTAVRDVSFDVARGESLAFIGPNGAGKSTTIKMLTGILQPTSGDISVLGLSPLHQRRELAMRIGTVFGQRSQLVFNLPLTESFALSAAMYNVSQLAARKRTAELIDQFDLGEFIEQPVRKLSLGQRMRAEVANALLHNPEIIFLDEPTIGLDIVAKRALRQVIRTVNRERGTTIFLTSHDVGDIEEVCDRTMVINHGQVILDAQTDDLKKTYLLTKTVSIVTKEPEQRLAVAGITARPKEGRLVFDVDANKIPLNKFVQLLFNSVEIVDITIEDTPLEDIIHTLYTDGADA